MAKSAFNRIAVALHRSDYLVQLLIGYLFVGFVATLEAQDRGRRIALGSLVKHLIRHEHFDVLFKRLPVL